MPVKKFTWPLYTAALHARHECTTYLLVIALTSAVATWARKVIDSFQPGSAFAPLPGLARPLDRSRRDRHPGR